MKCYYHAAHMHVTVPDISLQWRHNDVTSPASQLFAEPFIQAQIKENIKAPRHWPLWGEFTGDRCIPAQMASNAENVSICWRHHGLITESHYSCYGLKNTCFVLNLVLVYLTIVWWIAKIEIWKSKTQKGVKNDHKSAFPNSPWLHIN